MQTIDRRFSIFMLADKDATKTKWKNHFQNRSPATKPENASKIEVRALASGTAEMLVYDEIGYWGITAKDFAVALAGITASTINVRINSPGGDVFDGLAIYNSLKAHPATINTFVDGWAASAASFIMLAGDTVSAAKSSMVMIHNAWGLGIGNAADMRSLADVLDKIDAQIADIYSAKSGKDQAACLAAMGAETWFTGDEAKVFGLVNSVVGDDQESADDETTAAASAARVTQMRLRLALAAHD